MLCFHKPLSRILHLDDHRALPHAPAEHLRLSHGSALFSLSQVQMGASAFEEDEFRKLRQHKSDCSTRRPFSAHVALAGDFLRKKFLNFLSTTFWMLCSAAVSAACGGARLRGRGAWAGGED
jgi:hypothetical protein